MPTRQSVVSRVVPASELATAIPITAMTFNMARIVGPAMGSLLLSFVGVAACYFANGISFLALIWTALAIKSNLKNEPRAKQPIRDLLFEWRPLYDERGSIADAVHFGEHHRSVRHLLYRSPARIYGPDPWAGQDFRPSGENGAWLRHDQYRIFGALMGLFIITALSETPKRALLIRLSMTFMAASLIALAFIRVPWMAYGVLIITGMCSIIQFNTTNALFQLISTEQMRRGRVLAMHIWSLNGLSPFGILLFGWIASASHAWPHTAMGSFGPFRSPTDIGGAALAMLLGGAIMLFGAAGSWLSRRGLSNLSPDLVGPTPAAG